MAAFAKLGPVPDENYPGVARFVDLATSSTTPVYSLYRSRQMAIHMEVPGRIVDRFDSDAFYAGRMVYVDAKLRQSARPAAASLSDRAMDFDLRQRRSCIQRVVLVPERGGAVRQIRVDDVAQEQFALAIDGIPSTYWTHKAFQHTLTRPFKISFDMDPLTSYRSLIW